MRKRDLFSKHQFDSSAFEAFHNDSWQAVEVIRIEERTMILQFEDGHFKPAKGGPFSKLRIRSREATLFDCTCFLRPGVDICALLTSQPAGISDKENHGPVLIDAKIKSIERKPHEIGCECQYHVNFFVPNKSHGWENRILSEEVRTLELSQIYILQKLEKTPSKHSYYRWMFSCNCTSIKGSKLLHGRFLSDLTWLLVVSVLKKIDIHVRSMQNKIIYELGGGLKCSANSDKQLNAINFTLEDKVLSSFLVPLDPAEVGYTDKSICEMMEHDTLTFYDLLNLRRSKRRNVQPKRLLNEGNLLDSNGTKPSVMRSSEYLCKNNTESREVQPKLEWTDSENHLAIVPVLEEINPLDYVQGEFGGYNSSKIHGSVSRSFHGNYNDFPTVEGKRRSCLLGLDNGSRKEVPRRKGCSPSFKRESLNGVRTYRRRKLNSGGYNEMISITCLEGSETGSRKIVPKRKDCSTSFKRESLYGGPTYRGRKLNSAGYIEMIKKYMEDTDSTMKKEELNIVDQWKGKFSVDLSVEDEEASETEMLWRERNVAIASLYLSEDSEGLGVQASSEFEPTPMEDGGKFCQHEFKLDEQIGILCHLCGHVHAEIRDVLPQFILRDNESNDKFSNKDVLRETMTEAESLDFFHDGSAPHSEPSCLEGNGSVWSLIPDFESKLHLHQRKAFEFLWQNIAGSLQPEHMESAAEKRGGCVISHAMGAGKTLLIIVFLESYLKLFPGKRPLVLAPKTTLHTWYQEIKRWNVTIPIYQVHGYDTFISEIIESDTKPGREFMHVIDCLRKIKMWHYHPSILLMCYTSFLSLTQEYSKVPHKKYMSKVLRESPGILILDEGHNPRSTKSRLRKSLMTVKTDLRILLSGTLFQNNFEEYFNTLCLARPSFINEVLVELDPDYTRKMLGLNMTSVALENRARRFFIQMIASKIESSETGDRSHGLNMLRSMTSGFMDFYRGGSSDNLPGLHCYTLLMKPTAMQREILVKLGNKMTKHKQYMGVEILTTLGSIHPWLIKTTACFHKFFRGKEAEELERHKFDIHKGSKLKFVVGLVHRSILKKEKVLIFCHNIAPINLLLEIFMQLHGWQRNEEILVLQGDLELFERGRVIDRFQDPCGSSRILLASISACSEGIDLTAASRVILLDTDWNPSKRKQAIARAFRHGQERMVYVYQLLVADTLEEDKYHLTNYKEWISSLILGEELVEDHSCLQSGKIEDDLLREIVEEDRTRSNQYIQTIMKK